MDSSFFKIKNSKPFKLLDVVLYGVLFVFIALSFLGVFLKPSSSPTGFLVHVDDTMVISFNFDTLTYSSSPDVVVKTSDSTISFTIYKGDDSAFNVITVDKLKKNVKVTDASCKSRDCTTFLPIGVNENNRIIYCAHHNVKITSLLDGYTPPVSGGAK